MLEKSVAVNRLLATFTTEGAIRLIPIEELHVSTWIPRQDHPEPTMSKLQPLGEGRRRRRARHRKGSNGQGRAPNCRSTQGVPPRQREAGMSSSAAVPKRQRGECPVCLVDHSPELHAATKRLHAWFRKHLELVISPVTFAVPRTVKPKKIFETPAPRFTRPRRSPK